MSWVDSDGNGLADWWELKYFGTNGIDPYLDLNGDGWTVVENYQNGWDPRVFRTPRAPRNAVARVDATGTNVTLTWDSPGGRVDRYLIYDPSWNRQVETNGSALSCRYTYPESVFEDNRELGFWLQARYTNGVLSESCWAPLCSPGLLEGCRILPGPKGNLYAVVSGAPANLSHLNLYWDDLSQAGSPVRRHITLGVTNLVRGVARIYTASLPGFAGYFSGCQRVATDGSFGPVAQPISGWPEQPWEDARPHMRENLKFLLRSATLSKSFSYVADRDGLFSSEYADYWRTACSPDYEYYGAELCGGDARFSGIENRYPVREHYLWRNFVYDAADFFGEFCTNGSAIDPYWPDTKLLYPPIKHEFTEDPCLPLSFSATNSDWLFANGPLWGGIDDWLAALPEVGLEWATGYTVFLPAGVSNLFGLTVKSVLLPYSPAPTIAYAGGPAVTATTNSCRFYLNAEPPDLRLGEYYFASPTRSRFYGDAPEPPLPGTTNFGATTPSPVLVASVGDSILFQGWARFRIFNGYTNKFACLQQYFDWALILGTNALPERETGLLSPYGEFFPTEPGPTALVTMPDIETGERGTGIVHAVKLQLDVNHDGVMDLTFGGPDNTSYYRPFLFWANNDYDRWLRDSDDNTNYEDAATGSNSDSYSPESPWKAVPDYEYRDNRGYVGRRIIPCARDLEDFTRLWVCGITTNLLTNLPPGTTLSLSWGDVGNPNPNNPTIDLFPAADADGGMGYLTNAAVAARQITPPPPPWLTNQVWPCPYVGRLGPGQSLQLNSSQFTNGWAGNYFIWCGVSNGTGALTLTISQGGTNTLAQTTAYIQIVDIKQMYERWTVGDRPNFAPTNVAQVAREDITQPFRYSQPTGTNTPYILYVHGWNMNRYEKDRFAERAFKRLYWQGYEGRFGVFRWPTDYAFKGTFSDAMLQAHNYDDSESQAWKSATGLLKKLTELNAEYPGHVYMLAHSMGNVVAGEALRLVGTNQLVNIYVASQAAIPAHVYDASITTPYLLAFIYNNPLVPDFLEPSGFNYGPDTPNIYGNWLATNSAAVGRRVNFLNGSDFALAAPRWCYNQIRKPDTYPGGWYGYAGSTNDPPPWNHFYWQPIGSTASYFDTNVLTNRYEIMAYAAESRSTALGATPVGTLTRSIDLGRTTSRIWPSDPGNYTAHFWHSAQFRGAFWQQQGYWNELLGAEAFNLK